MKEGFIPEGAHRPLTEDEKKFIGFNSSVLHTKDSILKRLKEDGVYMGKTPGRTFTYYQEKNLIPKRMVREGRKMLFPHWVYWRIKSIRKAVVKGHSLSDIKNGIEASEGIRCEIRWLIPHIIGRDYAYTPGFSFSRLGGYLGVPYFYTISPGSDGIKLFRIESKTPANFFTLVKDMSVSVEKTIPLEEYGEFVKAKAIEIAKRDGMLLQPEFVRSAIMPINPPKTLFEKYDGFSFMKEEKF